MRPWFVGVLGASQVPIPCKVKTGGYEGADTDGEERKALLTRGETVDTSEDYGVGLQVNVKNGVWRWSQ